MLKTKIKTKETEKNTDKNEAILTKALQEFLKNGYMGTTMDKLAQVIGVSKPTIYSYFTDKETLFKAVIARKIEEFQRDFKFLPKEVDLSQSAHDFFREILALILGQMLNKVDQHHDFIRLMIGESGRFPDLAQNIVKSIHKPILEKLAYFLTTHPQIKCNDPQMSATIVMGSLTYYIMTQKILQASQILPLAQDRYLDHLVNLICD